MADTKTPETETILFDVDGMTCATCAVRIERILDRQEGVQTASVNLAGASAAVRVETGVEGEALAAAVKKIGYTLTTHDADHQQNNIGNLRITWKSLTALGVVGGLVPSVAALVILLAAISLHRIGFGLALILAFSVGMATVLAGLDLLLVYAG